MSRIKMVEFNSDEMMKRVNKKVHGTKAECFTRIANTTKKDVSTVHRWFRNGRMPAAEFYMLNDWIGTVEPRQMNFCEVGFYDLTNDKENIEIKKFTASPLRLTPPVEKRFRSLCDFLDYDASEILDRIVANYMGKVRETMGLTAEDDE